MNKILIEKDCIISSNDIVIKDNTIYIDKDSNILIEYINCKNINIEFNISNSKVFIYECSLDNEININNKYNISNSEVEINKFYSNKKVNENIDIFLNKNKDKVRYNFSNICISQENYNINIYHKGKNTDSNISNKSISLINSSLDFIINSNVSKEGIGSILDQNTRIVTMGECHTKILPNMFIDLEDTSCKHGSVIGTFNSDWIFYLMSKGINYSDTIKLLVKGYILGNINVPIDIKSKIIERINMYWR